MGEVMLNIVNIVNNLTSQKEDALNATFSAVKYNVSENKPIQEIGHTQNDDFLFIWIFIDGFLCLAIITGNVLTITAIVLSRRISLVVSNQFILSLAISDLLVGLVIPYHMMFYIREEWGHNFDLCIGRLVLVSLACIASVFNIIGIAMDRFLAIVYPLHYNKFMTKRLVRFLLLLSWIFDVAFATAPSYWNNWKEGTKCELGYVVQPNYFMVIFIPSFVLLFAIMSGFYVKIISEARKHAKKLRKSNHFKHDPPNTWKSTQVLMLVMGSFTISYMPFMVVVILNSKLGVDTGIAYKASLSLAMANSAVNPLIYAWKSREFKKTFSRIAHCRPINGNSFEDEIPELRSRRVKSLDAKSNSLVLEAKPRSQSLDTAHLKEMELTTVFFPVTVI